MKSNLINYTDKAIMNLVVAHVQQLNAWVKIGDPFPGPIAIVRDGKLVKDDSQPLTAENLIKIDALPPTVTAPTAPKPGRAVSVGTVKLMLSDIENFRTNGLQALDFQLRGVKYFHPYMAAIPHREWLETYDIGDEVMVELIDGSTMLTSIVPIKITQELIDSHSYALIRFALSD